MINDKIMWAKNYIKEYNKNEVFNPYAMLSGTYDTPQNERKQKIYIQCVSFLNDIENLMHEHDNILKGLL